VETRSDSIATGTSSAGVEGGRGVEFPRLADLVGMTCFSTCPFDLRVYINPRWPSTATPRTPSEAGINNSL